MRVPAHGRRGDTVIEAHARAEGRKDRAAVAEPASDTGGPRLGLSAPVPQQRSLGGGVGAPSVRDARFRRLLALADLCAAAGGLSLVGILSARHHNLLSLLTAPLIVLLAKAGGRYDSDDVVVRKSTLEEVPKLLGLAASFALGWSVLAFLAGDTLHLGAGGVALLWALTAALLILTRALARLAAGATAPVERVLIVGSALARERLAHSVSCDPSARLEVVGFLPLEDERRNPSDWGERSRRRRELSFDDLPGVVHELKVDRVLLLPTSADNETMLDAVSRTTALGVKVSIVPRLFEVVGSAVVFDTVGGITVLGVRRPGLTHSSRMVKRAMDVLGAGLGLLAMAPIGVITGLLIRLDTPGPVFFRQLRVGRDGKPFEMIKFRSMIDGADAQRAALQALNETDGVFKLTEDPRVTRVGGFLRRTSFDELPQLLNVLRGDMSLVGPRPLVLDEDRLVEGRHRERLQFAPGMTGPWQVLGPRRPPLSEMVKTDYLYAANWSLWTDVKILLRTLSHVTAQRGL
jgi:exopolysaccharide biosynthesis polyprenyl glycosylphosphotransferase